MCKKRNFICLCWIVILIFTVQISQAKSGHKIVYIPENDIKKYGLDVLDGKFGYDCMAESEVRLTFEGIAGDKDFYTEAKENAGWRYGFVAVKQGGNKVYGKMNKAVNGVNQSVKFVVPDNTQFVWLVVTGAPDTHIAYHKKMEKVAEWPYKIKLEGSSLHATVI